MSVKLNGTTGIDGVSVNATTPNTGNFKNIDISAGTLSTSTGQNLNFSINGSQQVQIDTSGNLNLATTGASFQNAAGAIFSPYTGLKNKIINGNFDIWQRATSQTVAGYGSNDRWLNTNNGSTKYHSQQKFELGQTEVPNNPTYYSRTIVTSVAGATNNALNAQRIEGVAKSSGKTMTLSFWAKSDANRNIAVEFPQYFGTGGSPSAQENAIGVTTFALTTNWQKFTKTVTFPSVTGKTIGTNNDDAYCVFFWFDAGSSYNARTNSLGQQSGTFDMAQVQFEEGSVATEFEDRPVAVELSLCQRYYERSGYLGSLGYGTTAGSSGGCSMWVAFNTPKRTIPTCSIQGTFTVVNCGQPTTSAATINGVRVSTVTTVTGGICSVVADSDDDVVIAECEL